MGLHQRSVLLQNVLLVLVHVLVAVQYLGTDRDDKNLRFGHNLETVFEHPQHVIGSIDLHNDVPGHPQGNRAHLRLEHLHTLARARAHSDPLTDHILIFDRDFHLIEFPALQHPETGLHRDDQHVAFQRVVDVVDQPHVIFFYQRQNSVFLVL